MNMVTSYFRDLRRGTLGGWNRFWFSPTDPATLGIIRIFAGAMLFYTHLVWTLDLNGFLGQQGWVSHEVVSKLARHSPFLWSYFFWIHSPAALWTVHIAALVVFALLMIGCCSRTMAVLAFIATVSYANRISLAQFGLDDTNAMLALYLMVGPCGAAFSVDRWLKRRKAPEPLPVQPSIGANIAIRLLQVHLCVIYLCSGIGKAQGAPWWNGDAILMVTGMYEYQSIDITWLYHYRTLVTLLAPMVVFWELSYCVLIWPRLTRPIVLAIGIGMHLGIGAFLGMWTFGLAMIIANLAFVSPWVVRRLIDRKSTIDSGDNAGQGGAASENISQRSEPPARLPKSASKPALSRARS
jgi:hypothetical protein